MVSPRTREDACYARAYVSSAYQTSPDAAREYIELRREHADAYAAMAVSDEERRFAAALQYAVSEADAALRNLAGAR